MAVLVRLTPFSPNTLIQSAQVNAELNQLVDLLAGTSTTKNAVIKFSDATVPVLELNQLGAGLIAQWKQNSVEKARVNNDGSLFIPSIKDTNNNAFLIFSSTASAVNQLTLANAATGNAPILSATGSDSNIGIAVNPKGTGSVTVTSGATGGIPLIINTPASPTVDLAQFQNNGSVKLQIKNNGQIVGVPKKINTDTSTVGNVLGGLDDLHTFSLPAGSLNANGDYLRVRYSGLLANNTNTKRIVISFGGVTAHDPGLFSVGAAGASFTYDIVYIRLSATSVRVTILAAWNFINRDTGGVVAGSGFLFSASGDLLGLADLGANATTMKVAAESGAAATDDIKQNFSIIELIQNT